MYKISKELRDIVAEYGDKEDALIIDVQPGVLTKSQARTSFV